MGCRIDLVPVYGTTVGDKPSAGRTGAGCDLDKAFRVRGIFRAHNKHDIALWCDMFHRVLAVGRRVADVLAARTVDLGEAELQDRNDFCRVIHRQGRLGGECQFGVFGRGYGASIFDRLDQSDVASLDLAHRAFDLRMAGMSDQKDMFALRGVAPCLDMNLGHQWTGRIDGDHVAVVRFLDNGTGHPVGGKDDWRAFRHLVEFLDEDGTLFGKSVNHGTVMHDLVTHIHRCAEFLQRHLDDAHGAINAGAETARCGKMKVFPVFCHGLFHAVVLARIRGTGQLLLSQKADRMRRMKHQPRTSLSAFSARVVALGAAGFALASCTSTPDYVACPEVSAPREGTQAYMRMDDTREVIDVRMNGVNGLCEAADGGATLMNVSIGLKLKRAAGEDLEAGVAQIDLIGIVVGPDNDVVETNAIKYKAGFAKGQRLNYPVAEYKITVADGNRLVLSLLPALR